MDKSVKIIEYRFIVQSDDVIQVYACGKRDYGKLNREALQEAAPYLEELDEAGLTYRSKIKNIGRPLYKAIFNDKTEGHFRQNALRPALEDQETFCRISIVFQEKVDPYIISLPWEFLFEPDEEKFLGTDPNFSLSYKYEDWLTNSLSPHYAEKDLPLRVLFVHFHPADLDDIGPIKVRNDIKLLGDIQAKFEELTDPTVKEMEGKLRTFRPHVFHLLTHGRFDHKKGEFALLDSEGKTLWYDEQSLRDLFQSWQPQAVVLQACESGQLSESKAFAGPAGSLMRQQVPAVVSMRYPVEHKHAWAFNAEFYRALAANELIDFAVQQGRHALAISNDAQGHSSHEFAIPTLWMRSQSYYLFSNKEDKPTEVDDTPDLRIFSGVPDPPPNYLPRPEYMKQFRTALLEKSIGLTGAMHVGIEGMGGVGKSVLAAELARDDAVQDAFQDGIFWLTFGQKVRNDVLLAHQNRILKLLGHQGQEELLDISRYCLNTVLHGKHCLFIIDDIWDSKHLKSFDLIGTDSCFLLTSRKADVLDRLRTKRKRVDLLSEEQALALLAQYAGYVQHDLPLQAEEIVRECGQLPLAVAAIGSMIRNKPPNRWRLALHKLQKAKLDKIACKFDYQYENLFRALQVSVETLPVAFLNYYKTLAVFPEETQIPESVVIMFWEHCAFSDDELLDVVDALVDASLLTRIDNSSLRLHDLLKDYLINQTDNVAALHKQLLGAYAAAYPCGWHTIPYEAPYYFHNNWAFHANKSGCRVQRTQIAEGLIRHQSLLNLKSVRVALKFTDYQLSDFAPYLLKENRDPQVIAACLKALKKSAEQEAWILLKKDQHPSVIAACLKILGTSAKKEAHRLLKENHHPNVVTVCLKILGGSAQEEAHRLLKKTQHPNVTVSCLKILGSSAQEEAHRLLKENQHPFVTTESLRILGSSARKEARRLLIKDQHSNVAAACLRILGSSAKKEALYLLQQCMQKNNKDGNLLTVCLSIVGDGDEGKKYARLLIESSKDEWLLLTCIGILGKESESTARQLSKNSRNKSIRDKCRNLLALWKKDSLSE
ncbi:MAG: CHAT domain-containing protein [Candidatus Electrothrix sp. AR4]|nr:CHAT domain-containing protein [Candidatus Electrothrix sp. AR4]